MCSDPSQVFPSKREEARYTLGPDAAMSQNKSGEDIFDYLSFFSPPMRLYTTGNTGVCAGGYQALEAQKD